MRRAGEIQDAPRDHAEQRDARQEELRREAAGQEHEHAEHDHDESHGRGRRRRRDEPAPPLPGKKQRHGHDDEAVRIVVVARPLPGERREDGKVDGQRGAGDERKSSRGPPGHGSGLSEQLPAVKDEAGEPGADEQDRCRFGCRTRIRIRGGRKRNRGSPAVVALALVLVRLPQRDRDLLLQVDPEPVEADLIVEARAVVGEHLG